MENHFYTRKFNQVAQCPLCAEPHHYVNVKHPISNDPGYWVVKCSGCAEPFCIADLHDVNDSFAKGFSILSREEGDIDNPQAPIAHKVAIYNLNLNKIRLHYDYATCPLYECTCTKPLDLLARKQLDVEYKKVNKEFCNRMNYAFKGIFNAEYIVAKLHFTCECGVDHVATYYTRFIVNPDQIPPEVDDYILADVSGAQLSDSLDGIRSKNDAMDLLAKLIMRWNLLADQVLLASPFIGHLYLSSEDQMKIWEWLLNMLDPRIAIFITRTTAWNQYRKSMNDARISVDLLEDFGLENKVVSAGQSKQDFHAKFYAGISDDWSEVYSGSANLVRGPSMENTSFRKMTREAFDRRYITRMALKSALPQSEFKAAERSLEIYSSKPAIHLDQ